MGVKKNWTEEWVEDAHNQTSDAGWYMHVLVKAQVVDAKIKALATWTIKVSSFIPECVETDAINPGVECYLDPNWKQKHHKCIVILDANTIVDPGAMVVESLNATVANSTMPWSSRPDNFALRTEISWVNFSEKLQKVMLFLWLKNTRVLAAGVQERQENQECGDTVYKLT